jgi:hypothetical protein
MSINVIVSGGSSINVTTSSSNLLNLSTQGYTLHANTHENGGVDPIDHNLLRSIQGGQSNEYYHLTSGQYVNLGSIISSTGTYTLHSETGAFYATSNPSGFITGINNIVYDFGNQNISGIKNFYIRPTVNGTGVLLIGEVTAQSEVTGVSGYLQGQINVLNNQTGSYTLNSETGAFYAASNPSGFITGINLSNYITNSQTGAFYASSNPSGFITGVNLSSYATIEYVTGISGSLQTQTTFLNNQTGNYALKSNTGLFLTTGTADNRYVTLDGDQTIYNTKTFSNDVYINRLFVTGSETIASTTVANIQSPYIILNLTGGATDGGMFFITGAGLTGVNDSGLIIGFDHSDKFKFGVSTRASDLSTLATIGSVEQITGLSGYLQPQITNLNNQTGNYYLNTNPSGYITGINNILFTTGNQAVNGIKSFSNNFIVGNNDLFVNTSTDRVGIFTNSPNATLDVNGTGIFRSGIISSGTIRTSSNLFVDGSIIYMNQQQALFQDANSLTIGNAAYWTSLRYGHTSTTTHSFLAGNVGIGTTTPSERLTVSGNIRASGDVTANNLVYNLGDQIISGAKTFATGVDISGNLTISGTYNIYQEIEKAKILALAYAIAL